MNEVVKKYMTWKWLAGAACVAIFVTVLLVKIFSGNGKPSGTTSAAEAAGPEQVLERFYDALVSGDRDDVRACCDTSSACMEYVEGYMEKAAGLMEKESGALSIVADMIRVEVTGRKRSGGTLEVTYGISLDAGETGQDLPAKKRTAVMRQEEGQWKIVGITAAE